MACCLARSSLLPSLLSPPKLNTFLRSQSSTLLLPTLINRSLSIDTGDYKEVAPRSVPVRVAHDLLRAGHRYLDVRTAEEFNAGHPPGATNIPYMFKVGSEMTKNTQFVEEVSSVYKKEDDIIIGCKSGRRSLLAAADLLSAGFTGVTDVAGGYSAWVQNGLPTHE